MIPRCVAAVAGALLATSCLAGHGLINSFGGIEWLPDATATPADWRYRFERWGEEAQLALAADDAARVQQLGALARERIAECEALVRLDRGDLVPVAVAAYEQHLAAMRAALETTVPVSQQPAALLSFATLLLEHRYIVSTDYLDLPRASRPVLARLMEVAATHYAAIRPRLSRRVRDGLFFKEEEVRWSWEQALGADAQGL